MGMEKMRNFKKTNYKIEREARHPEDALQKIKKLYKTNITKKDMEIQKQLSRRQP